MKASPAQPIAKTLRAMQLLNIYLWLAMALLFVQGTGSLVLRLRPDIEMVTPLLLAAVMNGNLPHAVLHLVYGLAGLVFLAILRANGARIRFAFLFGIFYTALGFLGIIVMNPFGLRLAWQENVFHLTVGPLMLALAYLAWRSPERIIWGTGIVGGKTLSS